MQIDGMEAEIVSLTIQDDSRYSVDYSHKNFAKINIGMTKEKVIELVGEPFAKFSFDNNGYATNRLTADVNFQYSAPISGGNYRCRLIYFSGDKVKEIGKGMNYED